MSIEEITKEIIAHPEVTKSEAFRAVIMLGERIEQGDDSALAILHEIAGCAATCDSSEYIRRFIVWELNNGPIVK